MNAIRWKGEARFSHCIQDGGSAWRLPQTGANAQVYKNISVFWKM